MPLQFISTHHLPLAGHTPRPSTAPGPVNAQGRPHYSIVNIPKGWPTPSPGSLPYALPRELPRGGPAVGGWIVSLIKWAWGKVTAPFAICATDREKDHR